LFPVRREELARLLAFLVTYFLLVGGIILGRNARDALFLNALGIKWLPYMYVANAFAVVACALVYSSFVDKISRARLVLFSFGAFIAALAFSRFALLWQMRWFYVALYMIVQVIWLLSVTLFWTLAGDLFDTRSSKRIFPLINIGGLVGMLVAGLGGKALVSLMGTENLLLVWAAMLVIAGLICWQTIIRLVGAKRALPIRTAPGAKGALARMRDDFQDGLTYLRGSPLVKNLALITLAQWMVFTLVDYLFNAETRLHFRGDTDAMSGFFGLFRGLAGGAALLIQVFAAPRLISDMGVGRTMLIHPGFLLLSTAAMRAMFGFFTSCLAKWGDHVLLYTVQESSYQLLYNPIPLDRRGRVRAFVEGYLKPIAMGVGGLVLVIAALALDNRELVLLAFALSLTWFMLARRVGEAYFEALVSNLGDRAELREMTAHQLREMRDAHSTEVLLRQLESDDEEAVLFSLEIMQRLRPEDTRKAITAKLQHPSPRVRALALRTLGEKKCRKALPEMLHCLSDAEPTVRAAAAHAIGEIGEPLEDENLERLLEDSDPAVRIEAAVALSRTGGVDGVLRTAEMLRTLMESTEAEERALAAGILGRLKTRHFTPSLLQLAEDSSPVVRVAALRALGESGDARALRPLVKAMADRRYRYRAWKAALSIVRRHPKSSVPELVSACKREPVPSVRARILEILGHCSGAGVLELCLQSLHDHNAEVQMSALRALWQREARGTVSESTALQLQEYAQEQIRQLYEDVQIRALLESRYKGEAMDLLAEAIETDNAQTRQRVLLAIGLLTDRSLVRTIMNKLESGDERIKADALEALDNLARPELSRPLVATLDRETPAHWQEVCRSVLGDDVPDEKHCLARLLSHASIWLRAVTAFFIGQERLKECSPYLETLLNDESGFVRETALLSLQAVDPPKAKVHVTRLLADPSPHVVAAARRSLQQHREAKGDPSMIATIDKILFLKSVPFFSTLNGEQLRELADVAIAEEFPAETVLYKPGDAADCLYIVVSGHCVIERDVQGQKVRLASIAPRGCFGEMSLLDGEPHTTTATLTEPSVLLKLTRERFRELIKEDPDVAFAIFRELTRRLREYRDVQEFRPVHEAPAPIPSFSG